MPRKTKASPEDKVQIVEAYLRGEIGIKSAAAKLAVVTSTIELWVALYRAEGPNAFIQAKRNRCYPPEVKEAAVREYLFGKDSMLGICQKYCIRSTMRLQENRVSWSKEKREPTVRYVRLCQFVCTCHRRAKTLRNLIQGEVCPFSGSGAEKQWNSDYMMSYLP